MHENNQYTAHEACSMLNMVADYLKGRDQAINQNICQAVGKLLHEVLYVVEGCIVHGEGVK